MVILNDNQEVCPATDPVTMHLSEAKTIIVDYKDHVVLQFTQVELDKDQCFQPQFTFKFVTYDVACKAKTKFKEAVKGLVTEDDVCSAKFKEGVDAKVLKKFEKHLKFVWKSA